MNGDLFPIERVYAHEDLFEKINTKWWIYKYVSILYHLKGDRIRS